MKSKQKFFLFFITLMGVFFVYRVGLAATNTFTETFATTTYEDIATTTADWNTVSGILQLPLSPGTAQQINCDIAKDSIGNFYFTWLDFRDGGIYGNIRAQKYNSSGVKQWADDTRVNVTDLNYNTSYPLVPHIALDSSNNVYITWNSLVSTKSVWLQKLNSSGVRQWAADIQVNATYNPDWYGTDIVCDTNGYVYVVFERESGNGIYIQKLDSNGSRPLGWESDKVAVLAGGSYQYDPSIAQYNDAGSNYFYVVYRGSSGGYYMNRLNADGVIQWTSSNIVISDVSDAGSNNVCVAADSQKMAVVGYARNNEIYLQKYNPSDGSEYWPGAPLQVTNDAYQQKNVEVSVDSSNDIYLAWLDSRSTTNFDVYAQKVHSNKTIAWTAGGKKVNKDDTLDQDGSNVVEYGSGCFVCWSDGRNSETSIYANRLDSGGNRYFKPPTFTDDLRINTDSTGYASSAQGQSLNVDTISENITSATLTATHTLNGQTITYYLSNDNGSNWAQVISGNLYTFGTTGSALRWRAVLSTANSSQTPTVDTIQIAYNYTPAAAVSITQIHPTSGTNNGSKTITVWGLNFSGTPTVKLVRTGQSDINATSVNVISSTKLTATFNLSGASTGIRDVVVDSATLKKAFTINASLSTITWYPTEINNSTYLNTLAVGDGNNDGNLEVYGTGSSMIYQFKYNGASWDKTEINPGGSIYSVIAIGDGNEDGDNEIYIACSDRHIYQFKWNGASWTKTDVGTAAGSYYMYNITIGDGNSDGKLEIYGVAGPTSDGHVYQFKWNGAGWDRMEVVAAAGASDNYINVLCIGDGNNDGVLEIYGASMNGTIYQLRWNGAGWDKTNAGKARLNVKEIVVSDADNNGSLEVYAGSHDYHVYQFKYNGSTWDKTDMGSGASSMGGISSGDGDNDGTVNIYMANADTNASQFKYSGGAWLKTDIGSGTIGAYDVVVGDADEDGEIDVYVAFGNNKLIKFNTNADAGAPKVVPNLTASASLASGEANLTWTSPGDDTDTGNNSGGHYIVRYANTPIITESDFNAATNYNNSWVPSKKGATETHYVGGLLSNTTYYFAIKTQDEIPYTSGIDTGTPRAVAKVRKNPFYTRSIYDDSWHYSPSGFMGENNGASMTLTSVGESPVEGTQCAKLVYNAESESWVGFFVLNNGWGGQGIDLSNYNALVFKVRASGTNAPSVEIRYGIGEASDSCGELRSDWIKISESWQTYSIDLSGQNLTDVNGLFMIAIRGPLAASPIIYLDDIKYVGPGSFAITDLQAVTGTGDGEIIANWTTPIGEANLSYYIVKYSTSPVTNQTEFNNATTFTQSWTPKAEGVADSHIINGLTPGTLYYIAIEAVDTNGAQAPLSNTSGNSAIAGTSSSISITSVSPTSGTNNGNKQLTIYGLGFASGVTAKLTRTGYSDIVGTGVTVVSGSEIRAYFDLNGKQTGLWNVYVERSGNSDTLENSFTITTPVSSPNYWVTEYIGSFDDASVQDIALGDVDNNGQVEIYGANYDKHIYQYKYNGSTWDKTDIGAGEDVMLAVAVGDGNNDGIVEVYGGGRDGHIYSFKWNGVSWDKQDLGNTGTYMDGIAVGDGNNNGQMEVYGGGYDGHAYQFRWTGTSWERTDMGSGTSFMYSVCLGDGNNDGQLEVYGGNASGKIYQFKYNGANWISTEVGTGTPFSYIYKVCVSDGNNDGTLEIYAASMDGRVYQFKYNGSTWDKTTVITVENPMYAVTVGDGDNDGNLEVYGANNDGRIYQCTWNGSAWDKERIDSGSNSMNSVIVGDGNNNGKLEVYGANVSGFIYQFTKVETPISELLKEEHVYDDSWHYPPSGFMGEDDGKSITLNATSTDDPIEGMFCNKITYDPARESWAGIFAQASGKWRADGGDGISLASFYKLTFKARIGADNSDAIQVQYGFGESGDTASFRSCWFTLTTDWQEFVIDLKGMNLNDINGLFMFNMREIRTVDPQVYLDDIKFIGPGPAAITDLSATRGQSPGEIRLTWTVPQGGIVSYVVKYSTFNIANQQYFDKATTYSQSWTPASAGSTEDKVLTGLTPGGYFYIAIESRDADGNQSSLSNIAQAMARTSGIGIMLDPSSISLGQVQAGGTVVSSTAIGVTNIGGVPVTLKLSLGDPPGWHSSTTSNGPNTFVLNAAFSSIPGNITWNNANHALSPTLTTCTSTKFAGDQTGVNIPLDGVRNLWVQFMAPTEVSIGTSSQLMYISITAEAAP